MPARRRRGFTLVQLIVVVALVTAQLAVLYALTARQKEDQRRATCQSNLKRCAIALMMYHNDWDSRLPSSAVTGASVQDYLSAKGPGWPTPTETPKTWCQVLGPYLRSPDFVFCPSDSPVTRVSYWWKHAVDLAWRDPLIRATRESDFNYPGEQVIFYEHSAWHSGSAAGIKDGVRINAVCMDSHVTEITVRNGQASYPSAADERTGASALRLGEPAYYNFDNETGVRATGVASYIDPRRYSDSY